jgi:hypothetical protein
LTSVFAICVVLYLAHARTAAAWPSRVGWSLHALMAVAMIAMSWPGGMGIPVISLVLVFTASALYFAYLGLFTSAIGHAAYHGAMMASMVVVSLAMSSTGPVSASGDSGTTMPGMDMGLPVGVDTAPAAWVVFVCGGAALAFLAAGLVSFYMLVRGPQRSVTNLLMTAGMGVAFAALAM